MAPRFIDVLGTAWMPRGVTATDEREVVGVTRHGAELMIRTVFEVSGKLDQALLTVRGSESAEDFDTVRQAVGKVMGEMHFELLTPLLTKFPDLAPPWWNEK
jgi:hypothetical protein